MRELTGSDPFSRQLEASCRNTREGSDPFRLSQPPARKGKQPGPDRLHELERAGVPVLVVQGDRDRFGMPPEGAGREVAVVAGGHSLRKDPDAVREAVAAWLPGVVSAAAAA